MRAATLFVLVCLSLMNVESLHQRSKCLPGNNHKEYPSPENSLQACQAYEENSCCSSEFTKQLSNPPIKKVGNFLWTQCNNTLSRRCEAFMLDVECFYRCSHNAIFWKNPSYPSAILNAPVCADFCDGWFDACKNDLTCAKNWITDFKMTGDGTNSCKQRCQSFSNFFRDGKELCEVMWGSSFVYKKTDCLQLNFTAPNPNDKLVEKLFEHEGHQPESGAFACTATTEIFLVTFLTEFLAFLY